MCVCVCDKLAPPLYSDKLRQALGVTGEEYPPYITRMRDLGYPPGYKLLQMTESLVLYGEEATGECLCVWCVCVRCVCVCGVCGVCVCAWI